ncbi:hypothetical protein BDZ91DRAFT_711710 [Kalaharituber pfeilii]|nr:hypothetical protein BDZ91DRAFT_711710 [Kalaharituber pfeilii]
MTKREIVTAHIPYDICGTCILRHRGCHLLLLVSSRNLQSVYYHIFAAIVLGTAICHAISARIEKERHCVHTAWQITT